MVMPVQTKPGPPVFGGPQEFLFFSLSQQEIAQRDEHGDHGKAYPHRPLHHPKALVHSLEAGGHLALQSLEASDRLALKAFKAFF